MASNSKKLIVIFGGSDHEEQAARKLARECGCTTATATIAGTKVNVGTAYNADGYVVDEGPTEGIDLAVIFECSRKAAGTINIFAVCDHHNPGDEGFGKGPEQFWQASSIGQLAGLLGVEPTPEMKMIAAGDHCPAAAYAGKCPGIDPEKFRVFRLSEKVVFYAKSAKTPEQIQAIIEEAKVKLMAAPIVDGVRDLRSAGKIEELPEAALSTGQAYMATLPDTDRDSKMTGNVKIVLGGHTTPEAVEKFMAWGNSLPNKVSPAYGNPGDLLGWL